MKYKTIIELECSIGLGQPYTKELAIIEHRELLSYRVLREVAIKAIGGSYIAFGVMRVVNEEKVDD